MSKIWYTHGVDKKSSNFLAGKQKFIALDRKGLRENPMSSIIRQIRITASNFREVLSAKRGNLFVLIPVYAY